jgi:hypothetical protein
MRTTIKVFEKYTTDRTVLQDKRYKEKTGQPDPKDPYVITTIELNRRLLYNYIASIKTDDKDIWFKVILYFHRDRILEQTRKTFKETFSGKIEVETNYVYFSAKNDCNKIMELSKQYYDKHNKSASKDEQLSIYDQESLHYVYNFAISLRINEDIWTRFNNNKVIDKHTYKTTMEYFAYVMEKCRKNSDDRKNFYKERNKTEEKSTSVDEEEDNENVIYQNFYDYNGHEVADLYNNKISVTLYDKLDNNTNYDQRGDILNLIQESSDLYNNLKKYENAEHNNNDDYRDRIKSAEASIFRAKTVLHLFDNYTSAKSIIISKDIPFAGHILENLKKGLKTNSLIEDCIWYEYNPYVEIEKRREKMVGGELTDLETQDILYLHFANISWFYLDHSLYGKCVYLNTWASNTLLTSKDRRTTTFKNYETFLETLGATEFFKEDFQKLKEPLKIKVI